jgi:hypothetical protein
MEETSMHPMKGMKQGRAAADEVTAYALAKFYNTDAHTERARIHRGVYGPIAGDRPLRVYRDEMAKRGHKIPKKPASPETFSFAMELLVAFHKAGFDHATNAKLTAAIKPTFVKYNCSAVDLPRFSGEGLAHSAAVFSN